jgi:uncharacterized membrane protein
MRRTSSRPWLHRFSRPLLGAIATTGAINTAYLTYLRFTSSTCPTQTCAVLESRYATIFGQPLALFGLLAYLGMIALALLPLLIDPETQKSLRKNLEDKTWLGLFAGATGMLIFSLYLMNIMFSEFVLGGQKLGLGGLCPFCLFSALLATSMFVIVLLGREWDERGPLFSIGSIVTIFTLVGSLAVFNPTSVDQGAGVVEDGAGKVAFAYPTQSGEAEIQLANHLKSTGAVMYGAYWCPHCCEQKLLFGKQAVKESLPYTECDPKGANPQTATCQEEFPKAEAQTQSKAGFPTWKVNGKYLLGPQQLKTLAEASNYKGPQDFKNPPARCEAKS